MDYGKKLSKKGQAYLNKLHASNMGQNSKQLNNKNIVWIISIMVVLAVIGCNMNDDNNSSKNTEVDKKLHEVVRVVDGDTLLVNIDGTAERLRLIGIDTPETVDPRKSVQCFSKEASDRAKELLSGKKVYLEADSTQDERDKYGRLLRYVIFEDGTNFNEKMIRDGYAHEYTYRVPYKYQEEFKLAQKEARKNKRGLWSDDTCSGDTTKVPE